MLWSALINDSPHIFKGDYYILGARGPTKPAVGTNFTRTGSLPGYGWFAVDDALPGKLAGGLVSLLGAAGIVVVRSFGWV